MQLHQSRRLTYPRDFEEVCTRFGGLGPLDTYRELDEEDIYLDERDSEYTVWADRRATRQT
jgi:hypothetical protein